MEHIKTPKIENVRLLDRFNARKPAVGTLYLTATHLIFVDPAGKKETWVGMKGRGIMPGGWWDEIMHMHIASAEKLSLSAAGAPIQIRCKTFQMATFVIPREKDCQELYKSLQKLSSPTELEAVYAFHYKSSTFNNIYSGWNQFDLEAEYARMGIPNPYWVPSNINKNYEICDTYPKLFHVPKSATTPILFGSARFRSRGRLPVLSYLHSNNAAMARCSQPLAGFSARCMEDEQMLQAILRSNPKSTFMYVVDTRPKINAMVNKASGKGYENTDFYSNIKFKFLGIENIHVMRNSLQKLTEVCELKNPSMDAFLSGLGASGWLKHIKAVVDTSYFIVKALSDEGVSVLVHCSDGWDRTAQTCSLSSIMLDPYYRTIQGFQVLIEKEWLAFGHKFLHRCGLIACDPRETSPIFTQFIDSVWQLTRQFPCQFQFNERFLLELHDHVFSCQFGNFLGNCEKARSDMRVSERTYSLWAYMQTRIADYISPLYKPQLANQHPVLKPNTNPQSFRFWRGMYNRYENGVHPREPIMDLLSATKDHSSSLDDHVQYLETKIASLRRMLGYEDKNTKKYDDEKEKDETEDGSALVDGLSNHLNDSLETVPKKHNSSSSSSPSQGIPNSVDNKTVDEMVTNHTGGSGKTDSDTSTSSPSQVRKIPGIKREDSGEIMSASLTSDAVESVASDWMSFRNIRQCVCSTPFDHFSRKYHCWKCGHVFCMRCIDKQTPLPGHFSQRPVPVCRPCYKDLKLGSSAPNSPTISPAHIANMILPPRLDNMNLVAEVRE